MNNSELEKEVNRIVHQSRYEKEKVYAVDVLMQLNYLTKKDYEDWRFGRIDFLEKVCQVNLEIKRLKKNTQHISLTKIE